MLWFAFILWTTDIYNNQGRVMYALDHVVICFHSLNYWYLQQLFPSLYGISASCDLLSFFELLIFTTTRLYTIYCVMPLWFAFILWTTDIYNNQRWAKKLLIKVVICFHSLNYWYLQQLYWVMQCMVQSCDLLSFFELLIFTTTLCDIVRVF